METKYLSVLLSCLMILNLAACASKTGNIALGAGAAGAVYEYSNKRALDKLDQDYRAGKITKDEYDREKQDIEKRSLIYHNGR